MPPTPPSTTSSSAGQSPPDPQFRVVRKRNRVPLSCGPCRHRKLKCNRGHPCDNCSKRGDTASCGYATPGTRKKSAASAGATTSPDDMQNRIDRLEGLVLSLMTNGAQSAGPAAAQAAIAHSLNSATSEQQFDPTAMNSRMSIGAPDSIPEEDADEESEMENVTKSIGVMKVNNNQTIFASEAHWYAILGELSEVKNYFAEHKKQYEDQLKRYKAAHSEERPPGTSFLMGGQKPSSRADVLSRFPPKNTADILVSRFFNTYDPGIHIIHGPTFQKEYDRHWLNPDETPIIWIGLVYSMICIALQSYTRAGDEPPEYHNKSWTMSKEYGELTAQCLIMADITQPITGMLETLILHIHGEYSRSRDAEVGILISTGIIVRLAMRMGLHRDPGPYPGISVFQGEMRRRVWAAVRSIDLLFSAQAGLPPIVRPGDTNTEIPRNIYDDELFEDMKTLPPSRPESEATPTLFLINRTRLIYKLGEAVERMDTLTCSSYDTIMKIDTEARELRDNISPHLKMRSMDESARDPSTLIMQRFTLDLLFLKIVCVLHRKLLAYGRVQSRYSYSRTAVIDASMTLLQHQATLHRECQPGGRLRNVKWFISSLTTVDFLLAAMIVLSDAFHTIRAERQGRSIPAEPYLSSADRLDDMLGAIETAVHIWDGLKDHSMEAYKAYTTLKVMLGELKKDRPPRQAPNGFQAAVSAFPPTEPMDDANVAPEHTAAMTLGMLSTGGMTPNSANMFDQRYPASMASLLNDPVPQQSSEIAPNYNGATGAPPGAENAQTAFSNLFGANLFQNLDLPSTDNLNWDAWDSYIQGPNIDVSNNFFPMDLSGMPLQPEQANTLPNIDPATAQQQPQSARTNAFGQNVFMGADPKTSSGEGYALGFMLPKRDP
ncbi:hypothetical protein BKA66DRAFT_572363 [Pyrenochaeta sp. MPI-SDFR-AT-0127]|nr:hypothetical protein BKA66DRAFT_572363 [Pyrenochaeta sp. MPI-SDFR-AT-0127]